MQGIRRGTAFIVSIYLFAAMGFTPESAAAAQQVRRGQSCQTVGEQVTVYAPGANKGKTYTCRMSNGKLKYGKPEVSYRIRSLLTISQVWQGNRVTLSLLNSSGVSCTQAAAQAESECKNFYIGWESTFESGSFSVTYPDENLTVLSGFPQGSHGYFHLMYEDPANPGPLVVKRFPFTYDY